MFDIDMQFEDIDICSIENEDVVSIQNWFNSQKVVCIKDNIEMKDFYKRFLECYASECEFFLKVNIKNKLVGIIRGRIEFKNPNEVWFSYFIIDSSESGKGLGSKIINNVVQYLNKGYGINNFYVGVEVKELDLIKFWKNNRFELQRVSKNFYSGYGKIKEIIILKREVKIYG